MRLPLADRPPERVEAPEPEVRAGTERILFIDDKPQLVRVVRRMLGPLGYRLEPFTAPTRALEAPERDPAAYDLVITAPDRDMGVFGAVRQTVGPDYPCIVDGGGLYTFDQTLRVGRLLDDLTYARYGSPMPETQEWMDRYATLVRQLRTPIAAGRDDPDSYQSRLLWVGRKACDLSRIGIHHGGLTACLELALACQDAGIAMDLVGTGPDAYPYLQLIAATDPALIPYFEVPSPFSENRLLPGRATPEPKFDAAGHVAIPPTPGMGLELDWQYIFTHRVA